MSFRLSCKAKFWSGICRVFQEYSDSLTISADQSTLKAKLMSVDHVAMVTLVLNKSAFESYDCENTLLCFNLNDMLRIMRRGGEAVELQVQGNNLYITLDEKRRFSIRLLATISEEIPLSPKEDPLTVTASLTTDTWIQILRDAEVVSNQVTFIAKENLEMFSYNEASGNSVEVKPATLSFEKKQETRTTYALEQLKATIMGSFLSDTVVLEFGKDYPLRLTYPLEHGELVYWIAPRVEEEQ